MCCDQSRSIEVTEDDVTGAILGVDYGTRRTGLAITDPSQTVVRSLDLIENANSSDGIASIAAVVSDNAVVCVVVGLPLSVSGGSSPQADRSRSFAARLRVAIQPRDVHLFDERYTSQLADHTRSATGTDASRDSLAACHLLEGWLAARRL